MSLSPGSELAVVTYGQEARLNLEPTVITMANREGVHGRVPGRPSTASASCPACGLKTAASLVSSELGTATTVILVTGTPAVATEDLTSAVTALEAMNVPLFTISIGDSGLHQALGQLLAPGHLTVLQDEESTHLTQLCDALAMVAAGVSNSEDSALKFLHSEIEGRPGQQLAGKFTVEESLRRDMRVILTTRLKEDVEAFSLVSPSGQEHKFPVVERGSVYFEMVGEAETGIWTYSIRLTTSTSAPVLALTLSATASRSGPSTVQLRAWSDATSAAGSSITGPVLLYAQLTQGDLPLSQATVVATVTGPDGKMSEITLRDDGTGYPDITAGDGVYSAYFTGLGAEPGYYGLQVRAGDGAGSARIPSPSSGTGSNDCCGSSFPTLATIPTPSFRRVVMAPSFHVAVAVQYFLRGGIPRMQDIFPPARVSDLRLVQYGNSSLAASLAWTAPGGDLSSGQATAYEIRCYTNRESLTEASFQNSGIPVHASAVPRPGPAGTVETTTVTLPWANEVFFYGVVAVDEEGNRSPVSNLLPVFAREAPTVAPQAELRHGNLSTASLPSTVLEAFEDNLMVYIISGCVTGIALIVLLVIVISLRISRSKSQKPKRDLIKEISSPTLIHSSSTLPGILKDPAQLSHLSVLPKGSPGLLPPPPPFSSSPLPCPGEYSLEYSTYPGPGGEDVSWAILPTYTNSGFQVWAPLCPPSLNSPLSVLPVLPLPSLSSQS